MDSPQQLPGKKTTPPEHYAEGLNRTDGTGGYKLVHNVTYTESFHSVFYESEFSRPGQS